MSPVKEIRKLAHVTQTELAKYANTSQPTIAMYETYKKSPNLSTLQKLASSVNLEMHIRIIPEMTRDQRRSLAFHKEITAELQQDFKQIISEANDNIQTMRRAVPNAKGLLDEWEKILQLDIETIILLILDPGTRGQDRRQVSPFAGILSAKKRTQIIKEFRKSLI